MKKTLLKTAVLLASLAFTASASASSTTGTATTAVDLEIKAWAVTIWAPTTINLGTWTVSSSVQTKVITMSSGNCAWDGTWLTWEDFSYFWVEDLKSSWTWYTTTLESADLVDGERIITADNIAVSTTEWTWAITTLNWLNGLSSTRPDEILLTWNDLQPMDSAQWMIWRILPTTPDAWIVWKYGFRPTFTITIPKYQDVWTYTAALTYTLTEL